MGSGEYDNLEDLVFSASFRDWVLNEDAQEAGFWAGWQERHPEKSEIITQARAVIAALEDRSRLMPEEVIDQEVGIVQQRLDAGLFEPGVPVRVIYGRGPFSGLSTRIGAIAVAFCILCLIGVSLFVYSNRHRQDAFHLFVAGGGSVLLHKETGEVAGGRVVVLPDGSKVRLDAGSQLYYPADVPGGEDRRAVFLDGGGAAFTIVPDASHPFYVYTNTVVVKAMGRSLRLTMSGPRVLVTGDRLELSDNHK